VKLIFQVLPDSAFASFCSIVHILECIVRHLCHFIELNLVKPIDNNTSRRTYSLYLCSVSVAQHSVPITLKKKHMQINHSLLTNSTKDLAESIVNHSCKSMVSIYYSWLFFCRIHGKKQETEQFHLKFLSHE
jgi:hypothetical protein